MKTNFYILLVLLLSFSFGNAQSTSKVVEIEINNTISVSVEDDKTIITPSVEVNTVKENDSLLINADVLKETIARGTSDIRNYINRFKNSDNIEFIFPKINKAVKA